MLDFLATVSSILWELICISIGIITLFVIIATVFVVIYETSQEVKKEGKKDD